MRKTEARIYLLSLALIGVFVLATFSYPAPSAHAASGGTLSGWAWSDTIGWISLAGPGYGLTIDSSGTISGYAWSDNIGWVSANSSDLSGCPSGTCSARLSNDELQGWLKALAADGNGWDGWISLSGSGYGPTLSGGTFSGYAWGSNVVGWVDFSEAVPACTQQWTCTGSGNDTITETNTDCSITTTVCQSPQFCVNGVSTCQWPQPIVNSDLKASPALLPASGGTATITWNVAYVKSCTVTGSNGDGPWTDYDSTTETSAGTHTTSTITAATTYTLTCSALDGSTVQETATVNVVPTFQEK